MALPSRLLGTTDLTVTPLGLGLAALGRPGYINLGHAADLDYDYDVTTMEARAHAALDAAWAAGVRYFDAARSYGRAEEFLGRWLAARRVPPGAVTIGSKWGYVYTAGWQIVAAKHEVKDHSLPVLCRQYAESRAFLGGHLGLYQIHSATAESGVLANQAVLGELARLKADGVRVGLSLSGPRQGETLRRALAISIDGARLFDGVQATWDLLERSAGPAPPDGDVQPGQDSRGVYVYDPRENTWSEKPLTMPKEIGRCPSGFYNPDLNAHFVHVADDSADNGVMWVYRYKK